ncbi:MULTISPECIES: hypothetical protein [unclassified Pseudoalteromonas]|uniref:hypothetical protein n=1 Tax=unclassified Pseudoalteromonas TaxID=194690 RepID=UPI00131A1642|nr:MULTISPECIES: hypothetical protein [unclassified Pseudoalteromonas]MBS3798581.1 hypothetical protein [Pseudoalteromonas sp. BDTF-M6]
MSKPPMVLALLLAAALTVDSLIPAPVFAIHWRSPEFMADIASIFNVVKLLGMALITAYLWWSIPRRDYSPAITIGLQFVVLICAVHTLVLLIGRQSLVSDAEHYASVGPYTVHTIESQDARSSRQVIYWRCQRSFGFYSLEELRQLPYHPGAYIEEQDGKWYYIGEKRYELAAGKCD